MKAPGDRLAWARERAGFRSARAAAIASEWPESTYRAHETGGRGIGETDARKYARRFRVHWLWILYGDDAPTPARTTFVKGYVGAGAELLFFDDQATAAGLEEIALPPEVSPEAVAVIVRGDSMVPVYDEGDILFYDHARSGADIGDLVGLRCIVKVANGPLLVKKLGRGRTPKSFTLWSHNAEPRYDQRLEWAAFVEWVRPSRRARR